MIQTELFSRDIYEDEPASRPVVSSRRTDRTKELLGRCTRCGAHITNENEFCSECLGTEFCGCHECKQLASLHRMLQNDLYWARRDYDAEQVYKDHLSLLVEQMRNMPLCGEEAA